MAEKSLVSLGYHGVADLLWDKTHGMDFPKDGVKWKEGGFVGHNRDVSALLRRLISLGYLLYERKEPFHYIWTDDARKIKAAGGMFINVRPKGTRATEIGENGAGEFLDVPPFSAEAASPGADPPPTDLEETETEAPLSPSPEQGAAPPEQLLKASESQATEALPVPEESPAPPVVSAPLPPLFLTPEEAEVFQLLGEAPKPLRLTWCFGLGLNDGNSLEHFLQKMTRLGILVYGPDQGLEEKIFLMDTVKYPLYLENHFVLNPEAAIEKLRRQWEQIAEERDTLQAQVKAAKHGAIGAAALVQQCQEELAKAQERLEGAKAGHQSAEKEVMRLEEEIQAANFPGQLQSIKDQEDGAERLALYNPLELHNLMSLSLSVG